MPYLNPVFPMYGCPAPPPVRTQYFYRGFHLLNRLVAFLSYPVVQTENPTLADFSVPAQSVDHGCRLKNFLP